MDIHITRKGEQHGPYPEANAREMLAAGQLLPTDLAWHAGADGWKPLSEVLGAATQPPATPPPSPPPPGGGIPKRTMAGAAPAEEKPAEEKPEDSEPDDPDKILVTRKGEPIGPYSREKAKEYFASGQLLPTDWGWHDGMDDWKPINEVLGLSTPPVLAAGATCPQCQAPTEGNQVLCMGCGMRLQGAPATAKDSKKKVLIGIGAGVGALAVIAGGWFFLIRDGGSTKPIDEAKKPILLKVFTNTLGMKFVPVPGTDVQFCIWETRVKDYAAYAAANAGVDGSWKKPEHKDFIDGDDVRFTQKETHPVVMASWNDAQAFCTWLTQKELAEGKIKTGQRYRLPTDAEWSVAVGLGKETGSCPMEKHKGVKGVYPWGKEWPPPWEAGNYERDKVEGLDPEADQFDYTSPVGSFAANKHGLHDLGGNASEWCEDKDYPGSNNPVLRGASWTATIIIPDSITLSSHRVSTRPNSRHYNYGFRCVLAGGTGQ